MAAPRICKHSSAIYFTYSLYFINAQYICTRGYTPAQARVDRCSEMRKHNTRHAQVESSCPPPYPAIGVYCFRANPAEAGSQLDRRNLVCSSPQFVHGCKIILTMHAVARGDYLVVPTTFR